MLLTSLVLFHPSKSIHMATPPSAAVWFHNQTHTLKLAYTVRHSSQRVKSFSTVSFRFSLLLVTLLHVNDKHTCCIGLSKNPELKLDKLPANILHEIFKVQITFPQKRVQQSFSLLHKDNCSKVTRTNTMNMHHTIILLLCQTLHKPLP